MVDDRQLQPLAQNFPIVDGAGFPTQYFIKWAQQRQIDLLAGITAEQAQALIDTWAAARDIDAGVALHGGGNLSADITIDHDDSLVTPGTYGDATHVPQFVVDQQGHVQAVTNVAITGGGGGKPWYWLPPTAASFPTVLSGNATLPTLTDDTDVGLIFNPVANATGDIQKVALKTIPAPGSDWEVTIRASMAIHGSNFGGLGIALRDSVGGRIEILCIKHASGSLNSSLARLNGLTGFNSEVFNTGYYPFGGAWGRIARVGANLVYSLSEDGKLWRTLATVGVTSFFANAPNQIGLGFNLNQGQVAPTMACERWVQSF